MNIEDVEYQEDVVDEGPEYWNFGMVWNKALEEQEKRILEPRDYLWASELSKPEIDVYLQMTAVEPSNFPNSRSLRKFEAGNLWEWIVKVILKRSGILLEEQPRVYHEYEGLLKVSGKIDFLAGGKVNYDAVKDEMYALELPPRTNDAMLQIVAYLQEKYPDGLFEKAIEIKSVSSFVMNACEITGVPIEGHALQAYHYTKHPDVNMTDLIYICRDDCRMQIFPIFENSTEWEGKYKAAIEKHTKAFKAGVVPEKGEPVVFDESQGRFSINRMIGWSNYLTLVYGFENQMEFEDEHGKTATPWNAVLKRVKLAEAREKWLTENNATEKDVQKEKTGDQKTARTQFVHIEGAEKIYMPEQIWVGYAMTPKNLEAIESMKEQGWDVHKCASMLQEIPLEAEEVDSSG